MLAMKIIIFIFFSLIYVSKKFYRTKQFFFVEMLRLFAFNKCKYNGNFLNTINLEAQARVAYKPDSCHH